MNLDPRRRLAALLPRLFTEVRGTRILGSSNTGSRTAPGPMLSGFLMYNSSPRCT
jgi:hypothetical protein